MGVLLNVGTELGVTEGVCVAGINVGVGVTGVEATGLTSDMAFSVEVGVGEVTAQPTRKRAILNIIIV